MREWVNLTPALLPQSPAKLNGEICGIIHPRKGGILPHRLSTHDTVNLTPAKGEVMKKATIKMNLTFADPPPVGLAILYDGQRYDLIDVAGFLTWSSRCRICDELFTCKSTMTVNWLTRNCINHMQRSFAERQRQTTPSPKDE